MIKLIQGDCLIEMKNIPDNSIDMIITSPPYDSLRNYNNSLKWNFDCFEILAKELYRVMKTGAVCIWVVGDQVKNGSESGSSFRQALYFIDLGLRLHDTMLYKKLTYLPLNHNRYEQEFEYMFCFSKEKPKAFNPIRIPCKYAGTSDFSQPNIRKTASDSKTRINKSIIKPTKIKGNIFEYLTGSLAEGSKIDHPAKFPLALATDQIKSWSNSGDTVLDCFLGSGTSGLAAKNLDRKFIGIEKEEKYFKIAEERINGKKQEQKAA